MERNVYNNLKVWKERADRKPLLVTGVRQCGKTYIIRKFGEKEFDDVAYFNLESDDTIASVFDQDFSPKRIIDMLGNGKRGKSIDPGKTLLILDEIQKCPRAITSLKYFCEEMPSLHLIAAGSLLGVAINHENFSFPVGKVNRIEMHPMSFSEFVRADGGGNILDGVLALEKDREIVDLYGIPLKKYLKNYYIIGGMPEVVSTWVRTHDFKMVEEKQDEILNDYEADFGKYAPTSQFAKIKMIWNSIPVQLGMENNKFIFSRVKTGGRASELEEALEWMVAAGLIHKVKMVPNPEVPLAGMADESYYKIYMSDVGLLCRRARVDYHTIVDGNDDFIHFKGMLTENFVLTELINQGVNPFFWKSENRAEVDFLIDEGGKICPIEVKSADNTKAKSLVNFCNRYDPKIAIKASLKNVGENMYENTRIWSLPLFCLWRLKEYLELR